MKLKVSPPALADLQRIHQYLSREASSEVAARQVRLIAATMRWLSEFPRIGQLSDASLRRKTVRHTPYIIFYRIIGDVVRVIRIRHNREDWRPE